MALYSAGVEYGIHCLLFLADEKGDSRESSVRTLAELQGVPPELLAKVFTRLAKAGLVAATEGVRGGFRLARPANEISVLDVVRAIDGDKSIFECREVRERCAIFEGNPPSWATRNTCSIHAVMLTAQKRMEEALGQQTILDLVRRVGRIAPPEFGEEVLRWMDASREGRGGPATGAYGAAPQARFAENTIVDCGANRAGVSPYPIARGRRRAAAGPLQWPVTNLRDR